MQNRAPTPVGGSLSSQSTCEHTDTLHDTDTGFMIDLSITPPRSEGESQTGLNRTPPERHSHSYDPITYTDNGLASVNVTGNPWIAAMNPQDQARLREIGDSKEGKQLPFIRITPTHLTLWRARKGIHQE